MTIRQAGLESARALARLATWALLWTVVVAAASGLKDLGASPVTAMGVSCTAIALIFALVRVQRAQRRREAAMIVIGAISTWALPGDVTQAVAFAGLLLLIATWKLVREIVGDPRST